MRKIVSLLIAVLLLNFCAAYTMAEGDQGNYLTGADGWAREEIAKARSVHIAREEILCDYSKDITREEFCELVVGVYNALGKSPEGPTQSPFMDTNNRSVSLAYALGVVSGVSETEFDPDGKITREQMAVMMNRLA